MAVAQADVIRVDAIGTMNSVNEMVNSYEFLKVDAGSVSDLEALDDFIEIIEAIYSLIAEIMNVIAVVQKIRARNVVTKVLIGEADLNTPVEGTGANQALPWGACGLVTFPTLIPHVILKKFFGILDSGQITSTGYLTGGCTTDLASVGAYLLLDNVQANGTWLYGFLSPKTGTFLAPGEAIVTNVPAYQRRRRPGEGS
jgi:hypothetical protein